MIRPGPARLRRIALALPLTLAACASPPLGDAQPGQRPSDDTDEAGLWQTLERDEFKLRTSTVVIREKALQSYLESVLCRVAPAYCADIRVYVLPSSQFGAAMTPNGMMLVYSGLLVRLENEAQLAAVLGHEVGHYVKRHTLRQWRRLGSRVGAIETVSTVLSAGSGIGASALKSGDPLAKLAYAEPALRLSLGLATFVELQAYSRDQELAADEYGVSHAVAAGYNADASGSVWDYLAREEALADRRPAAFLRTHPRPAERKRRATEHAARQPTGGADYRERFLAQMAPFRNSWIQLARQGLELDLQLALLERQRQIGAAEGLVSFHEASMYLARNGSGDAERALAAFAVAVRSDDCPPEAFRDYGLALWGAMRTEDARRAFEDYLAAVPAAGDRAMVASYVSELQ